MKKMIKNTIIFTSVLILSLMTSVIFLGSRVKAADLGDGSFSVEYTTSKMNEYYGNQNNIPTYEDGYLFAGWYEDEDCTISYVKEGGETLEKYYAKFVPQDVLSVKAQHAVALHNKVLADTDTGSIRFVTATDSNNYNEVGLHVEGTIGSHTLDTDYKVGTIYSYLYVVGDTTNDKSNPVAASAVFGTNAAEYFAPHAFKINYTQFDDDFTITPYWITPDGVRVDGVARTRNMIDNLEDYSYAEVNGRAYYTSNDFSTVYTAALDESSFLGTADSPTVMTLLKDNMPVTSAITIGGNLRYLTIQNKANVDTTISRGTDFIGNMFEVNNGAQLQLGIANSEEEGQLIIDGARIADGENIAVETRTVYLKGAQSVFILQKNATLQNANSTASGAAICNKGTCDLYGSMLNNQSSSAGSSTAFAAGAILQCRGSKTLTIYGGTYTGNKNTGTYGGGGLIGTQYTNTSGSAGAITIKGGTFLQNSANEGGVIYTYSNEAVTINDGDFSENSATTYGGVISTAAGTSVEDVVTGANIVINGGTFTLNKAEVVSEEDSTEEAETTEETTVETYGGVVYLNDYGTLTISGGEFTSNTAYYGGVLYACSTVDIEGGNFISNEATQNAGAIYFKGSNSLTIDGGTFNGNSAGNLGGVFHVASTGTVAINNASFQGNGAKSGGVISTSTSAGAITIGAGTSFTSNNATANGGAIVVNTTKQPLTINGGTFTENSAGSYGGAIHVAKSATLTIGGGTFTENSATTYGGVASTAAGSTTSNGATITITAGEFTSNTGGPDGGVVYVNKSGTLDIDGGTFTGNSATSNGGVVSTAEGYTTTTDEETSTETTTELPITVTINGGTFTENSGTTDGGVVFVNKYTSLTVNDGTFEENTATKYGGVISTVNGSVTAEGPSVTINDGTFDSNSGNYGGVVFVDKCALLEIKGGTFSNNSAINTGNGGVIGTVTGTSEELRSVIKISDGEFTLNNAEQYGGVVHLGKYAKLTIDGGEFTGNSTDVSGGVISTAAGRLSVDSTITINNGTFSSNVATKYGGVIFTVDGSTSTPGAYIYIANGSFTNNSATIGGAIYLGLYGDLIATGGEYNQNSATTYGAGALYVCNAEATLSNVTMEGNCASAAKEAYYGGGAITLHRDATVTLTNCLIYGNTHAGSLADTDKNTNGCDIAFSGGNSTSRTQTLILQDESFNGIIGHMSDVVKAKHQVKFSDGTVKALEAYNTRYIVDYDVPTLAKKDYYSVVLTSDMHYTTNYTQTTYNLLYYSNGANASAVSGPMFGYTQDERMEIILSDINDQAEENGILDAVFLLGDLSIDNKGYANLHEDFLKTFKDNYLSRLQYPWYAIAGNHDSYTDTEWETYMGRKRQYSVEIGNAVFIMLDTFEAAHATTASGSNYVGVDTEFLAAELAKEEYADKIIFLCAHYYHERKNTTNDAALQAVLEAEKADKNRIVCLFRGHSHNSRIITDQTSMAGIPIVDIGGYAYNPDGVDGDYNVFQEAYAWGYQVLEWDANEVRLYHVKPARTYTDSTTTYNYAGAMESELTIPLP